MTDDGPLALHTLRAGEPGGVPLVLLHGFPLDHRMWLDVVDLLPGDRTALAFDLPGLGASPAGEHVAAALGLDAAPSIDTSAAAVAATLRRRGVGRAVVAGLSMGGYVALALLEREPSLVAGLALVDTRATADDDAARERRLRVASEVEARGDLEPVLGMRTTLLGAASRAERPDLAQRLATWMRDQGPAGVAWSQRAMAARPDRSELLGRAGVPGVVIVGEEDEQAPVAGAREMADALVAPLVVVPRAGHMTTIENPEPVAVALAELARRADTA